MATFDELVKQIDDNLTNQRDRGTAFEHMVVSYLKNEPTYKHKFKNVWMLNEVPAEYGISKRDTGVDIVAEGYDGKLTAVQAKFYKGKVGKDTINSFIAETGKDYYDSGMLVSSTDEWNRNAQSTLQNTTKPFTLIGLSQLRHANVNWQKFAFDKDNDLSNKQTKKLRKYQEEAVNKAVSYFKDHNRGKLIMAPGTGKTFTSLRIAEGVMRDQSKASFNVLYLVPSIQLLSQTLFNWNNDVSDDIKMTSFSVVSDRKATKKGSGDNELGAKDVGFPATTNVDELMSNYNYVKELDSGQHMTVVFSTYQSIDVLHQAQEKGFPEFDLIIADEAHRTTGATKLGEDTMFTEVHSNKNIQGKLRLYQTATPRIYDANTKRKAKENSIVVSSMDDEEKYGQEIFRYGFGEAVARGYLTDYKVAVLAVNESFINKDMQRTMASNNELNVDDIGKIIGVWNAMVKRNGLTGAITGAPMKRAIAFTDTIKHSKTIAKEFQLVVDDYLAQQADNSFTVDVHHVDGGLNALEKKDQIDWLAANDIEQNHARVLSNVRFLTEGIDVPNLDAIIFFSPKKSQVDIVQAVGRIMRLAEGKEYGYIILPIVVPDGVDAATALDSNKNYKTVWQVLNALRSTDERFDAEINKLDLNKKKSSKINIIGVDTSPKDTNPDNPVNEETGVDIENGKDPVQTELTLKTAEEWKTWEQTFYGKIVQRVGNRRYLEDWSKDVAKIAKRHIQRIKDLIETQDGARAAFDQYLQSLQHNINNSIDKNQAIEMLAQHLITQPVFEALFEGYSFIKDNPVSKAMNNVVAAFSVFGFDKEQKALEPFYESVKLRAEGIDNAQAKQQMIVTLYDKFFSTGFKKTTDALGIVFTPVQVVDFIIHSVDYALKKYLGTNLAAKNVHILDPFTGTGTFITRTLEYFKQQMDKKLISFDDINYKYQNELHANEIVLLSYYIAAINIESVFDEINGEERGYEPFEGIVLTDTFESTERENSFDNELFGTNNKRLQKQQEQPITVIISNPPYSIGQNSQNDDNQNNHYTVLENRIRQTYFKNSTSNAKNSLLDSYIKAFRWASDRISGTGVIGFITNSGYIEKGSMDGIRKSLLDEFNHVYVFNLRGAVRGKVGQTAKKEGGNIFNIMTGVAITILIKDGSNEHEILYHDIGDFLSGKHKLDMISNFESIEKVNWQRITPDKNNDWVNQRDPRYQMYPLISGEHESPFIINAIGVGTNRDNWVIGFSKKGVQCNVNEIIKNYNYEVSKIRKTSINKRGKEVLNRDPKKIKWTSELENSALKGKYINYKDNIVYTLYRPFTKKWMYYGRDLIHRPGQYFNKWGNSNLVIETTGKGARREFSTLVTNLIPNMDSLEKGQGFMRFDNEKQDETELLEVNHDNVNQVFADKLGLSLDDTFAYVYGLLNSSEYQQKYANDLKKDLARIPVVKNKEKYVEIGKKLIDLHINYEEVEPYDKCNFEMVDNPSYQVKKMKFAKKRNPETGKLENDRSTIIFNSDIKIKDIPEKAYEYVVNGRSAIEWIMDQYKITIDKKSGITDDPNDFSDDPKYIFNLLLRIINVSLQTVDLIHQLPKFEVDE